MRQRLSLGPRRAFSLPSLIARCPAVDRHDLETGYCSRSAGASGSAGSYGGVSCRFLFRRTECCTLPPARVLYAAYDFGPDRTLVWPAVRAEHLTVHELSETTADATEGTPAGIGINWERCHYDWSQPGRVTATVTGSNVYAHPGSSWQLTATPSKHGSRVEMVWQRTFRRNPRGLFFGTLFRIAGRPIFGHYARQVIANLEALERNPSPHQMARRPSGTQSADQGC